MDNLLSNERIQWLMNTVEDKDTVWKTEDFAEYMNYMGYTYELNKEAGVLKNVSASCRIVHIPSGVLTIQNLFTSIPYEDTAIIVPTTVIEISSSMYSYRIKVTKVYRNGERILRGLLWSRDYTGKPDVYVDYRIDVLTGKVFRVGKFILHTAYCTYSETKISGVMTYGEYLEALKAGRV